MVLLPSQLSSLKVLRNFQSLICLHVHGFPTLSVGSCSEARVQSISLVDQNVFHRRHDGTLLGRIFPRFLLVCTCVKQESFFFFVFSCQRNMQTRASDRGFTHLVVLVCFPPLTLVWEIFSNTCTERKNKICAIISRRSRKKR